MRDRRIEAAEKKALAVFDYILEVRPAPKFIEIVASVGGDIITRRYYDNGEEYDR